MVTEYRMYWITEAGCEQGSAFHLSELQSPARERVAALTREGDRVLSIHMPFLDKREWRRRVEVLRELEFVREGDAIRAIWHSPFAEMRQRAAQLVALHPAWRTAAKQRHPEYFPSWQPVSVGLQKAMRQWVPEAYFADIEGYADRERAFPMLVYSVCRPCFGKPRTEFTYDVADAKVLNAALKMTGRALQDVLAGVEARLYMAGMPALARRYAPVWHSDIVRAVLKRPRKLLALLGRESMLINSVIELGGSGSLRAVKPFAKDATLALRSIHGMDLRALAFRALEETTAILARRQEAQSAQRVTGMQRAPEAAADEQSCAVAA